MASNLEQVFFDFSVRFEFGPKERQKFYTKLSQLLENGVSLDAGLMQLSNVQLRKSSTSVLGKVFGRWRKSVSNGMNFGLVMSPYVPSTEAILLETGANTGHLVDALRNACETVESQNKVKSAIISSSSYPIMLILMLIAALVMSTYQVIPTFSKILPVEEWTGTSAIFASVAGVIRDYGMIIVINCVTIIFLISYSLPRWTHRSRLYFENIVPWNLYRMWQGSSFLLSISALMKAGVKLDEVSLNRITRNAEPYLMQRVQAIKRYILSGDNLGDSLFKAGYNFPEEDIISDLQIYARLRGFDDNLIRITKTWVDELVIQVQNIMKVVNIFVLFLIATTIGFMISSLYGVVQQIQDTT